MSDLVPLVADVEPATGFMRPGRLVVARRLSDMAESYQDQEAVSGLLAAGEDPLVYQAYEYDPTPDGPGELVVRTTVVYPGTVGGEYFMTRGHHHVTDSGEVYLGLAGRGQIVMQRRQGPAHTATISPGRCVYVPAGWAHRTINDGDEPFVFLAVYAAAAGHDYTSVASDGFAIRLRRGPNGPEWSRPVAGVRDAAAVEGSGR